MIKADYNSIIESWNTEFLGNNLILVLRGHNGYDDTICHYSQIKYYEIRPTDIIGEILNIQNALNLGLDLKDTIKEPYYTVSGCIDLDKFKLKPIKENEESPLIKPYKDYIVFCGNKFAVANSCQGVDGGYFVYPNVQAFLPLVDYYDAQKIFKKYVEVYKKLDYMKKDFE